MVIFGVLFLLLLLGFLMKNLFPIPDEVIKGIFVIASLGLSSYWLIRFTNSTRVDLIKLLVKHIVL